MADPGDPFYRTARNALCGLLALVASFLLLVHQITGARTAVLAIAGCVVLLALVALAFDWVYGPRTPVWLALALAFVASRSVMALATGRVFSVRDALVHIYGLPLEMVRTGGIPDTYVYSAYPVLHLLLAITHLVTQIPLWEAAALLAILVGLATMAFVVRISRATWAGTGLLAGLGFLVAYYAIPPGQLFQPLTVSILFFAALVYLAVRDRSVAWGQGIFFLIVLFLGLTHPYSSVIIGLMLFVALVANAFLGGRIRYLIPMGVALGLGVAYVAWVGQDLTRFLDLLQPNDLGVVPAPGTGAQAASTGTSAAFSQAYTLVSAWGFRLAMGLALVGLALSFFPWPPRTVFLQSLLAFAGLTYMLSRVISYGFPTRVLTIAAVAEAPFIGLALKRSPRAVATLAVAVLAMLAVTSPAATYQLFPFSDRDPTVHALDDPPETAEAVPFFLSIQAGDLSRSNPISSHQVFHEGTRLLVRSFTATDVIDRAPRTHYFYREEAAEFGFAVAVTQAGSAERRAAYEPFPTDAQLDMLDSIDRIGDFGTLRLSRA